MTEAALLRFRAIVGDRLRVNEPLATHVHFRIGGRARAFAEARTSDEVTALVRAAMEADVPLVALGSGTNVLVSDQGFEGLVIKLANRAVQIDDQTGSVTAEAGVLSSALARKTAEAGLSGLEWAVSLPGTIGGAVRGNAGCFGGETKDTLVAVDVVHATTGEERTLLVDDLQMQYRESRIKREPWIVLRATFQLARRPVTETTQRLAEVLARRLETQPKNAKSAGCAFKNVLYTRDAEIEKLLTVLPNGLPEAFQTAHRIPAGWLIDQAELKGMRVGGAAISDVHANFITNDGTATADDIAQLIALVKTRIRDRFGIHLHEEVQLIGFGVR